MSALPDGAKGRAPRCAFMFLLFSSKLGCLGSLLISGGLSLLLLYLLGWL